MQQKEETNLLFVAAIGIAFFIAMRNSNARYVMGPNGSPIVPPYLSGMSAAQQWQYQLQMQQMQQQQQASVFQGVGTFAQGVIDRIWPTKKEVAINPVPPEDAVVGQVAPGLDGVYSNGVYYPAP